jgi:hypothetical protein
MKATMKASSILLKMAAVLLTLALADPAAAKQLVPFKGSFQGVEIDVVQFPTILVDGSGTGIARHLGLFTVTWDLTVNLLDSSATGTFHFIAANGDSIFTEIVGQAEPTETPGVAHIVEINTITGGTGRFAGATGSFTMERLLDQMTGVTSGSFSESIASPGAAKH